MNDISKKGSSSLNFADEIQLDQFISILWSKKWYIIIFTTLLTVISIMYSLKLPNQYRAEVLLSPVSSDGGLNISGGLGGLAALAGVNLGGTKADKPMIALQVLTSREFIGRFIDKHDLLVPLMASNGWDLSTNSLKIDSTLYDQPRGKWLREPRGLINSKPSLQEAHSRLVSMLETETDKVSGMIKVSIEFYSPVLAKEWLELLIKDLNEEMRNRDLAEAENSISYLTEKIKQTSLAELKMTFFSLIEEQTKTVMLTNVREEYVFSVIDPPIVPEQRSSPNRVLFVLMTAFVSFFISIFIVLFLRFIKESNFRT